MADEGKAKIVLSAEDRTKAAFASAKAGLSTLQEKAEAVNVGVGKFVGLFGAGFAVGSFTEFITGTARSIDRLNDLKDATGSSIENLSALEDTAARTGTSFEAMSTSVVKFNKVLAEAKSGSETAEILKTLGLNAAELKRIDPAEALRRTAVALARFADDGNKARIVQALFGKSVQEVAPFLNDLAKQTKLVAKVTTEQAEAAEKFNQQMDALKKNSVDAGRAIAGPLISAINETIEKFRQGEGGIKGFFDTLRREQLKLLQPGASSQMKRLAQEVQDLEDALGRPNLNPEARKQFEADLKAKRQELRDIRREAREESASLNAGGDPGITAKPKLPDLPDDSKKKKKDLLEFSAAFLAAQEHDKLLAEQLAEFEAVRTHGLELQAEQIDAAADAQKRFNDELQKLIDATPTAKLEETRNDMLLLADAFERGKISAEQFTEAAQARLGTLPEKFKETVSEMDEFSKQAARNIQDALGDTVFDTLSGKFDDIGSRWANLLKRMASEAIAAQLGKALFGDFGKTGVVGGVGGDILKELGSILGFGGLFASGGTLGAGKWGIAGEAGPEIIRGPAQVVPMTRGGGYTDNRTINNYIDANADQARTGQIVAGALHNYDRDLMQRLRAAGLVSA